jgi:hypothetical protein
MITWLLSARFLLLGLLAVLAIAVTWSAVADYD